jgi:hypothetical protein
MILLALLLLLSHTTPFSFLGCSFIDGVGLEGKGRTESVSIKILARRLFIGTGTSKREEKQF